MIVEINGSLWNLAKFERVFQYGRRIILVREEGMNAEIEFENKLLAIKAFEKLIKAVRR